MRLPQTMYPHGICHTHLNALLLAPPLPCLTLDCSVVCSNIIIRIYYTFIYCCDENVYKYLKTAGTCELKVQVHILQPGIIDYNGNKCKNVICNTCMI